MLLFLVWIGWGESNRKFMSTFTNYKQLFSTFVHLNSFCIFSLVHSPSVSLPAFFMLICGFVNQKLCAFNKIYWHAEIFCHFICIRIGPKEFQYRGKNYFLSSHVPGLAGRKVDWLDGRNLCREYCMDLVTLETQEKNNLIFRLIQTNDVPYIWTAGRLCDFKGCENRPDLEPKRLYGWFWSSTRQKM